MYAIPSDSGDDDRFTHANAASGSEQVNSVLSLASLGEGAGSKNILNVDVSPRCTVSIFFQVKYPAGKHNARIL